FRRAIGLAALLAIFIVILEVVDSGATDKYDFWFNTKVWSAYRIAADFVFGALLCVLARGLRPPQFSQWLAWGVLGLVFVAMFADANIYLILGLFGIAITLAALADKEGGSDTSWLKPVAPVTAVSFGVYLWHPVIELFAYSLVWKRIIGVEDPVLFWLYMPIPAIVTIIVAIYSARHLERPLGKWLESTLTNAFERRLASSRHA
ncbi:MAG: hypothetical protein RID59_11485, partial [Hoeflea sp.]